MAELKRMPKKEKCIKWIKELGVKDVRLLGENIRCGLCTMIQNSLILRHKNSYFPTSLGVSERASERMSEQSEAREQGGTSE